MSVLVQTLLGIIGAIVAVGVGYIGYRQWLTAQDKLKLELSGKRWDAYHRLREAAAPVMASGTVRNEDADAFALAMQSMHFLFNTEIEREAKEIYDAMLRKHALDAQLDHAPDRQKALIKSQELFTRITRGVYHTIPEQMAKLMRLRSGL